MTKGQKSGRRELKPSLAGHKAPAKRAAGDDPVAAADPGQAAAGAEVGQDVDCFLPDSGLVREVAPPERGSGDLGKTPARRVHKVRSGPDR